MQNYTLNSIVLLKKIQVHEDEALHTYLIV